MQMNYKYLISSILLSIWTTVGWAQIQPQLNFTLTTDQSGSTKEYVARDYIILSNGFLYTATPGQKFIARIDKTVNITLSDGTVIQPDGTQVKPDGTQIKPDGTIQRPDGTIQRPDGTIFKTNGVIINPDGTIAPNVSLIVPAVWFKTMPVTADINGSYKWKDFSPANVPLVKYATNGTAPEYTVRRDSIMNYNFNPALDLSSGNTSKEIVMDKSNLAQATIMGVWGSKKEVTNADKFIFALNGRRNESVVFTKSSVYSSLESGKEALIYGSDTTKNLLCQSSAGISARKARESALRIGTYFKSNKPNTGIWGEVKKAVISLGGMFSQSNTNNTSTFISSVSNLGVFKGYSPELLVFDRVLSPVETSIFESYLAVKYGVSMDRSYLSGTGRIIWDYKSNAAYNNRITGYGREDLTGLNQRMATTSYQEAPYYSDSCDSYLANGANNLSSSKRLLVMGSESDDPMNDGQYVLFGDDNKPLTATGNSMPGYKTMQRKWLVNANRNSRNWIELSYFDSLATDFAVHKNDTYLIVDSTGTGEFSSYPQQYLTTGLDASRLKIIFKNIRWAANKKNYFTFGYKSQSLVKRHDNSEPEAQPDPVSDLRIYYPDLNDLSHITVKLQTVKPTSTMIMVFDMAGRNVFRKELPESIDVQYTEIKLPTSGVFIVKVLNNETRYTQKVVSRK